MVLPRPRVIPGIASLAIDTAVATRWSPPVESIIDHALACLPNTPLDHPDRQRCGRGALPVRQVPVRVRQLQRRRRVPLSVPPAGRRGGRACVQRGVGQTGERDSDAELGGGGGGAEPTERDDRRQGEGGTGSGVTIGTQERKADECDTRWGVQVNSYLVWAREADVRLLVEMEGVRSALWRIAGYSIRAAGGEDACRAAGMRGGRRLACRPALVHLATGELLPGASRRTCVDVRATHRRGLERARRGMMAWL